MERKIGEEFNYYGVKLKVEKGDCNKECVFYFGCTRGKVYPVCGECKSYLRTDNKHVRFIRTDDKIEMKEETKTLEIPEGWEFDKVEDGKIVLKEKKKELPKTWTKCLCVVNDVEMIDDCSDICKYDIMEQIGDGHVIDSSDYGFIPEGLGKPMLALCQLLVCRNAWWGILNYKPNWLDHNEKKYCIHAIDGYVTWSTHSQFPRILVFPTQEVCEEFKEAFKDLIEKAKELL